MIIISSNAEVKPLSSKQDVNVLRGSQRFSRSYMLNGLRRVVKAPYDFVATESHVYAGLCFQMLGLLTRSLYCEDIF